MKKFQLSLILIAFVAAAGCDDDDDFDDIDDIDDIDDEFEPGDIVTWDATLSGLGPYTTVGGTSQVSFTRGAASFTADAEIFGDEAFVDRPWHVHFGTCATGGDIVGPPEQYPPLSTDANGSDTVSATVASSLDPLMDYHVNFHLSAAKLEVLIACGDLVRTDI